MYSILGSHTSKRCDQDITEKKLNADCQAQPNASLCVKPHIRRLDATAARDKTLRDHYLDLVV